MTLRHLDIFIHVYQLQSITKAAKQMHIAQPSISLAIKELEEYYHICLFDRMNRKIYPTDIAHQFYQYAIHILDLYHDMEKDLKDWSHSGTIRIGSSITVSQYILPKLILRFKEVYPQIDIQVDVDNSKTIERYILENRIDFGLIETMPNDPNIIKIPFMSDQLCTIVSLDHPLLEKDSIHLSDLLDYPFLMREKGSSVHSLVESVFLSHQLELVTAWQCVSTQAIIHAVSQNIGISTLPYLLVKEAIEKKQVQSIQIPELAIKRDYHIIYHKNKYMTKRALDFFKLSQEIGQHLS